MRRYFILALLLFFISMMALAQNDAEEFILKKLSLYAHIHPDNCSFKFTPPYLIATNS